MTIICIPKRGGKRLGRQKTLNRQSRAANHQVACLTGGHNLQQKKVDIAGRHCQGSVSLPPSLSSSSECEHLCVCDQQWPCSQQLVVVVVSRCYQLVSIGIYPEESAAETVDEGRQMWASLLWRPSDTLAPSTTTISFHFSTNFISF